MGLFRWRWFRSFVRSKTGPIPRDVAEEWRTRLSKFYVFLAFNISGMILLVSIRDNIEVRRPNNISTEEDQLKAYSKKATVHVVRLKNFDVTEEYQIAKDTTPEEKEANVLLRK